MAFNTDLGSLFTAVCRWLSANWAAKPSSSVETLAVPVAAPEPNLAPAATMVRQFDLASRLSAVARHNLPVSRPAIKVTNSRQQVPLARLNAAKSYKETRLPTTVAVKMLTKPVRASADVISLDAARRSRTQRNHRIAA